MEDSTEENIYPCNYFVEDIRINGEIHLLDGAFLRTCPLFEFVASLGGSTACFFKAP